MSGSSRRAAIAFACLLLSGCSATAKSPAVPLDAGQAIAALQARPRPDNVLAYDVQWTTTRPSDTELVVACEGLDPWSLSDATASSEHHVFLMGLVAGASCELTARAAFPEGTTASAQTQIRVGELPSYLPPIELSVAAAGPLAPGWTLINLSNQHDIVPYTVTLIDPEGRYRWYYQYPTDFAGSDTPVSGYEDGVLVGGHRVPISYVTWQGELIWSGPSGHHEARPAETAGDFYTLSWYTCPTFANEGEGGMIIEYDAEAQKVIWRWALCDHYTPPQDVTGWAHLNTVALFPDHKSLLLSSRNQSSIMKIDRASEEIVWVMGYHGEVADGFHGDFTIAPADTIVLPSGHILMFDNGDADARPYSRALEIAYTVDPSGVSEAHAVWQYRHSPDILALIWGAAQRLENGDTLVCFGQRVPGKRSTIDEVSSDSRLLWEIETPEYWGVYRARRVPVQHGSVVPTR